MQKWLWFGMFLSFAIKVPMWPFHTWLPDAHVEAPTVGSMILAGILLKVGGFAFLRISLPILPEASAYFSTFVILLSAVAVIYTSLVAFAQTDIKKLLHILQLLIWVMLQLGYSLYHKQVFRAHYFKC